MNLFCHAFRLSGVWCLSRCPMVAFLSFFPPCKCALSWRLHVVKFPHTLLFYMCLTNSDTQVLKYSLLQSFTRTRVISLIIFHSLDLHIPSCSHFFRLIDCTSKCIPCNIESTGLVSVLPLTFPSSS
ncbi:hypothetical protein BDP27DRAFT_761063 [Rhodocollybia butyracea]|uniref:Uncharacterized protein n=1 Tax=Rhodocollybia butyracea TaxID=206335 RepID=A0A9P5P610_9AGAR|nr:hypothetical protein BDP27DRAFT_761063 [Rhodocollybia butyracea]